MLAEQVDITCKNYRKDTETCTSGCRKQKVIAGNPCPFDDGKQADCKCYGV
jgi:hypothetical protein